MGFREIWSHEIWREHCIVILTHINEVITNVLETEISLIDLIIYLILYSM